MDLAREIVACALRERDLKPFLSAGITRAFLANDNQYRNALLGTENQLAYMTLLEHWERHGKVPSVDLFQKSWPTVAYELPDSDYTPAELVKQFQKAKHKLLVDVFVVTAGEALHKDQYDLIDPLIEAYQADSRGLTSSRLELLSLDDLDGLPDSEPLIEGILDAGTVTMFYGFSGTAKSFVAVDWALSIASGIPWLGHASRRKRVLYVAAEGGSGYKKRARAWLQGHQGQPGGNISFIVRPVQMNDPASVQDLLDAAKDYDVIILDTLAKLTAGKSDSDAEAMGLFVDSCYKLRDVMGNGAGGTVIIVHHTGYDKSHSRGWTGINAGIDNSISVEAPDNPPDPSVSMTFKCMKRKDDEAFRPFTTRLVKLGPSAVIEAVEDYDESLFGMGGDKAGEKAQREKKVREVLAEHGDGTTVQKVHEATGIPYSTSAKILKKVRTTANTRAA